MSFSLFVVHHYLGTGVKYGAIFVDEVLSDFIEDSLHVPAYDLSSYAAWLHQWIGSLYVARGVVFGTFSTVTQEQRQQKRQRARGSLFKEEKRRRRILISLASSILPLLVNTHLYCISFRSVLFHIRFVLILFNQLCYFFPNFTPSLGRFFTLESSH